MTIRLAGLVGIVFVIVFNGSFGFGAEKPVVFVSIVPQKFFVEQLAGDVFDVGVMVKPGASPATYEPKPSQMAKLSSSAAYLAIGVPFERNWLPKFRAVNPSMKIIDTGENIEKISMAEHLHDEAGDHSQGHRPENHGRRLLDPHIWLSPILVKKQVLVTVETLKTLAPELSGLFDENCRIFLEKLDRIDEELRSLFKDKEGMHFMVFHPSWGYFAREYGLEQVAIEMEGKEPKPAQLLEIIRYAQQKDIRVILVQRQFSAKKARVVAKEISGRVLVVDPLAENWFDNIRQVARAIHAAVK